MARLKKDDRLPSQRDECKSRNVFHCHTWSTTKSRIATQQTHKKLFEAFRALTVVPNNHHTLCLLQILTSMTINCLVTSTTTTSPYTPLRKNLCHIFNS